MGSQCFLQFLTFVLMIARLCGNGFSPLGGNLRPAMEFLKFPRNRYRDYD
ncbi:hypothetical protein NIES39_C00090 [Arthrospira platensis NIES-39]|nr:hypothetical protein NIES39_C00090 [Arthrospira platensis NIES-39]